MKKKYSVLFLGRKPKAVLAAQYLLEKGIEIVGITSPNQEDYSPKLNDLAQQHHIPVINSQNLIETVNKYPQVDLVISYLYWNKIKQPIISFGRNGCINYHPALLPQYKGLGGYNLAILHNLTQWGSTVHYIDSEAIDSGPIINVSRFAIDQIKETAYSLEQKTQVVMLKQFKKTILRLIKQRALKTLPNTGGMYFSKKDYDRYKRVTLKESPDELDRKIRAFWYPPYDGAFIEKKGQRFTLVTQKILRSL